jgi:HCOMODA/2-hydroxy-3-carboxy-muconic semialdehyde decarboxylase
VDSDDRKPYLERFIHAAIYKARTDVQSVVHSHSPSVIPFSVVGDKIRPVAHSSATIGPEVPIWDSQDRFGDTDLLISDMSMAEDFARVLGGGTCALMRGHGCTVVGGTIREAVYTAIYLERNADLQLKASRLGNVKFLSPGEIEQINSRLRRTKVSEGFDRAWEYWCCRSGIVPEHP